MIRFEFDWDPAKAESNRRKHGVAFEDEIGPRYASFRLAAKSDRDFARADTLRDELAALGYEVRDGADGYRLSRLPPQ